MSVTHKITLTDSEQFFYDHAGCSFDPSRETASSGLTRNAILLASAEEHAKREGWDVEWDIDPEADIIPTANYFVSGAEQWTATLRNLDGEPLANLCGIDLGHNAVPETDPYARVIAAELATEAIFK